MLELSISTSSRLDEVNYCKERQNHWNYVAKKSDKWTSAGIQYHKRLTEIYRHLIPPGKRILEIGCGQGNLLAALKPKYGLGIDFAEEMVIRGKQKHPELEFICGDIHDLKDIGLEFDIIILSDLINDLWDIQRVLQNIHTLSNSRTRVIINFYSRVWQLPLSITQALHLSNPLLYQNWVTKEDVGNLLDLCNFEPIRGWQEILFPVNIPLIAPFLNKILVKLWPFNQLALTNFMIARPIIPNEIEGSKHSVSVVVPARNETGNIINIFNRVPQMGSGTELIFVEGHSKDNTYQAILDEMHNFPAIKCQLLKQNGKGKGDAVREGFAHANGDILMILDADLTVPPEDLPRFYEALVTNKAEFINGIRLVYPMDKEAMRFFNLIGNKFFSIAFSWLLGQTIKDTLCGTKVLWNADYQMLAENRNYFGDFDPFGDYDLLFGAAKLNFKIIDLPIRYRSRTYGTTNIQRWKHGWLLLKMVLFAAGKIKFC